MSDGNLSFPDFEPKEVDKLRLSHDVVRVTPFNQPALAYSLILPKGWRSENDLGQQEQGIGTLVKMGLFVEDRPRNPAVVQVFYCNLPFEVGLRDWLEYQSEQTGIRTVICKTRECACGPAADVGGTYGAPPNQFVVRSVTHADNGRIFMVSAMVERERYTAFEAGLGIATGFFRLLHPTGGRLLEPWVKVECKSPGFAVARPATWSARSLPPKVVGKSAVDLYLAKDDKMLAYLRVKAVDPVVAGHLSIDQNLHTSTAELQEAEVTLESDWKPDEALFLPPHTSTEGIFVAEAKLAGIPTEARLALFKRGSLEFAATLICVTRSSDPMLWLRSKRAYEISIITASPL